MKTFGPYSIELQELNHAVIRRSDGTAPEPTFYELQHMKCLAFGGDARAVEIFPATAALVDGQHQRHLWRVPDSLQIPDLRSGLLDWIDT